MKRRTFYILTIGMTIAVTGIVTVGGMTFALNSSSSAAADQQDTSTPIPTQTSTSSVEIKSPEPASTPSPEIAFFSRQVDGGGYYVEAGVNTWGAAESVIVKYQGKEVERIASGETEVIASTSSNTLDPLPEGAELVAYARDGGNRTEILRWKVESGGASI